MSFLCRLGIHRFELQPHTWADTSLHLFLHDANTVRFPVECMRGCGARSYLRCDQETHWREKHREPTDTITRTVGGC